MASWKKWTSAYFSFTKKERTGIITLVVLICLTQAIPELFRRAWGLQSPPTADTGWISALRNLEQLPANAQSDTGNENNIFDYQFDRSDNSWPPRRTLFYFDPNTLTNEGWQKLGLRTPTIKTIRNYLSKGGRFRDAADFAKVYGLRKAEFEQLSPFIRITKQATKQAERQDTFRKSYTRPRTQPIDVNLADTAAWIALPGIGTKLATRITLFRERLGGFYSIEQVSETYGLADSVFNRIRPLLQLSPFSVRKLNLNTATLEELKSHPYLKTGLAAAIVNYRQQHGPFTHTQDLLKILPVTKELYEKLVPYLGV
jgi:competence protein ComEA